MTAVMLKVLRARSDLKYPIGFLAVVVSGLFVGWGVLPAATDDYRIALAVFAVLAIPWLGLLIPWRSILVFCLFWIVFEALLRRYLVDDILLFFIKDLLFGVVYFRVLSTARALKGRVVADSQIVLFLGILVVYSLVQMFNPYLPNFVIGLLGFRIWFWYIPLMFVAPFCFQTKNSLIKFLRYYAYLGIPVCLFGFIQSSTSLPSS